MYPPPRITLAQMKGKYVVNEKHLIQLLKTKCPLCGSKVKVEKAVYGTLIVLNQQCQQCEHRNQWKSQVNATVPAPEPDPTEGTEVTLEVRHQFPAVQTDLLFYPSKLQTKIMQNLQCSPPF